eukprot:CAMPEP_0181026520 /NCGR_PEP_ID=MMETSP1070-20121207/3683_1 /TAXON_ID=265543 /ORGANISM="Minutocellus polymorphus, Strain NH13" /LENGTH=877 /DNA_ID=CAMNT_0023103717 /DNA_START=30 /DNA_END=2664 /DNA_ORIENTATION=-
MSLAASGGGAGLGAGIAAHGGPSAMATHAAAHAHHQGGASHAGPAPGVAPPGSFAALAADVVDRGQNLTLRGVRGVAGLPVVAIDLYGDGGEVAAFPPVAGEDEDTGNASGKKQKSAKAAAAKAAAKAKAKAEEEPRSIKAIGSISVNRTDVVLKKDDDATHKAVRRLLTKGFGYETVMKAALMEDEKATNDAAKAARIVKPHLLLGVRRTAELDPATLALYTVADADGAAIAEVSDAARSNAVTIRNGTLDGSARPNGDDFDRVAFHLAIHGKKKGLTMLPDEAVGIVVAQAKRLAYKDYAEDIADADDDADSEEAYLEVPTAVAVPGWNCSDATSEALIEACGGGSNVALYQRPVAAAVGSLLPRSDTGAPSKLLQHVGEKLNAVNKERQMRARTAEARGEEPDGPTEAFHPVLVYAGATAEGLEMTAVQLSKIQDMDEVDGMAPFGDFKVITSVAYRTNDPMSKVKQALNVLTANIDEMMPELFDDDGGPVSFVTYGSISTQLKMREALTKALAASSDEDWSSGKIPFQSTKEECVACGVALLAAVSHGRLTTVVSETRKDGKQRAKGKPAVVVQNSSCSAVGVRYNYFGGSEKKWSAVKTVFDFDRRVPAGPYSIEFSAAECAAIRANGGKDMEEEELLEASKTLGGAKNIPAREEAALALRVQVVQQLERDGTWIKVGDVMKPLTMTKKNDDDDEDDDDAKAKAEPFACEESILELSLNPVGMLTNAFISDGQSVVQATKSARNSAIRYYVGIAAAILFFGGFMVKSYMEEKIFERDVQRVLAFYKHAAPGSISDGDDRNARWLVYKYKGRKDKLWRRLEVKYDMEVKQAWEWDDDDQVQKEDGETEDLDGNSDEPKGDEQGEDKQDDEPDL